ncbi:uncharacterized protein LOC142164599 [Nicotiana tabacum]|uniref:Uncharacterized protein LOC142164599 n=1 Tax=Nicotiana tabacum TaxID=4097 RepID=A0AC58S133_TOBAC
MVNVSILIQYNGVWQDNRRYVKFDAEGILINSSCNYEELVTTISKQIKGGSCTKLIDIKYIVQEGYPPISISNDMNVQLYIDLKMKKTEITSYPLCITFKNNAVDREHVNPKSSATSSHRVYDLNIPDLLENGATRVICNGQEFDDIDEAQHSIIRDPSNQNIEEGQLYQDKETIISVMKHCAIRENFQFRVQSSCTKRYCLVCVDDMCTWNFVSSRLNKTKIFKVRKFSNVHNYGVEERMYTQRHATSDFIGYLIQDKYVDPKTVYTPADIRRDIKKIHGFDVNYMKAWRSKEKALEMVRGNPSKSYTELPNYLYMLMHTNPGSVYRLEKTDDGSFLYLFVAIYALIKGWEYCKPIVVVDGSFLKSTYRGTIITASAQDDAGKIFPLAYSIVDSENEASWEWFFERFRETYGVREGMCIVSDRHESIAKASSTVFPSVPHCVCIFHLWNNIKVKFKKNQLLMKDLFFAAAKAYTIEEFEHHMSEIDDLDKRQIKVQETYQFVLWLNTWRT